MEYRMTSCQSHLMAACCPRNRTHQASPPVWTGIGIVFVFEVTEVRFLLQRNFTLKGLKLWFFIGTHLVSMIQ